MLADSGSVAALGMPIITLARQQGYMTKFLVAMAIARDRRRCFGSRPKSEAIPSCSHLPEARHALAWPSMIFYTRSSEAQRVAIAFGNEAAMTDHEATCRLCDDLSTTLARKP